jgi:cytochrome c biogenesis protein CcmG, thiol:disulfide interchange protein DsbE
VSARSRTPLILAAVVVLVGFAALLAVVLTRGDDDEDGDTASSVPPAATHGSSPGGSASSAPSGGTLDPITGPTVTVEGTPLPPGEGGDDPGVGLPAPTLHGTDYTGAEVSITPGTDGPLMVVFLAHWCPHCNDEIPVLLEWRDSGGIPEDLQIIGVSTAASEERPNYPPDEWLEEKGWTWPVLADDAELTAANTYGVTGFPYFVIVDADGNVAARGSGEISLEDLDALVDDAIA